MSIKKETSIESSSSNLILNYQPYGMIVKVEPTTNSNKYNIIYNSPTSNIIVKEEHTIDLGYNFIINPSEVPIKVESMTNTNFTVNNDINIKIEPIPASNMTINSLNSEFIIKDENIESNFKVEVVKEEYCNSISSDRFWFNNDEPMLIEKQRKLVEINDDGTNEMTEELQTKDLTVSQKKKKQRTPRSKLINEIEEHVMVTKLTLEEQIEAMNKRKELSSYLKSPYKCDLCYKGFIDFDSRELHLQTHSPSAGTVECPICKVWFKRKHSMSAHVARHEMKYTCKYCNHVCSDLNQVNNHLAQHKEIIYTCKLCGESFNVRTTYLSHVRSRHPPENTCNICGYSYISKKGLNRHKVLRHEDVMEKEEAMPNEGASAEECVNSLERHSIGSTPHLSSPVSSSCSLEDDIKMHSNDEKLEILHMNNETKPKKSLKGNLKWPAKCEHCSDMIQNARDHWYHYRRVHPDKQPVQKSYVCEICDKSFAHKSSLADHKRTHTGERPYKCSQCNKTFGRLSNLHHHEKGHSDECPFVCHICHMAFKFKKAINRHLITHASVKPYRCEICNKTFSSARNRKVHITNIHPKESNAYL